MSQLASDGVVKPSEEKRIEADWIEFVSQRPSRINGLTSLRKLVISESQDVTDLSPILNLTGLTSLTYGNAYPGSDNTVHIRSLYWIEPLVDLRKTFEWLDARK